jgi:hypothetical protein
MDDERAVQADGGLGWPLHDHTVLLQTPLRPLELELNRSLDDIKLGELSTTQAPRQGQFDHDLENPSNSRSAEPAPPLSQGCNRPRAEFAARPFGNELFKMSCIQESAGGGPNARK